jgi:hypothetical protein
VAAGRIEITSYLRLLEEITPGSDRHEMEEVIGGIQKIAGIWSDIARGSSFQATVRRILEPEGKRLGWDPKPGESEEDALLRPVLLGTLGHRGHCRWVLSGAAKRARRYVKDPTSIPPEIAGVALSLAAREGKISFDTLEDLLAGARAPAQRTNALVAMADLPAGEPIGRALDLALTDAVRIQDVGRIVFVPLGRAETRDQGFRFFRDHFDEISKRMPGGFARSARWPQMIGNFCTEAGRDEASAFFEGKKSEGSARYLSLGTEQANECIALRAAGKDALALYLIAGEPGPAQELQRSAASGSQPR